MPHPTPDIEMPVEVAAAATPTASPGSGPGDPAPAPALTVTPEPPPTPEPTPTLEPPPTLEPTPTANPVPETASVREPPLDEWSPRLSWRWLKAREFRCESAIGRCWGILVRASAACPDRLEVTIRTEDARGRFIGSVSVSRRSVRRGGEHVLIFESPNRAARRATVSRMVCD
jgi:hypothetical protein